MLEPIAPGALLRMALVTGTGKPRERTVQTYAQWLANHEQSHSRQIERIVNTQRTERHVITSKEEGAHGDA